jgi:hypothetical protein
MRKASVRYHAKTSKEEQCLSARRRAFLEQHLSPAVLEVFPDWQGFFLECQVLGMAVWIVRTRQDGRRLHEATGQPALLLDDVLTHQGQCLAEMWEALQPGLIVSSPHSADTYWAASGRKTKAQVAESTETHGAHVGTLHQNRRRYAQQRGSRGSVPYKKESK